MKPTAQVRPYNARDPNSSLARYIAANQHPTTTTGIPGHPIYLTQHPSFSALSSQVVGSSPHSGRDYHPHHGGIHGADISGAPSQRTHLLNPGGLGLPTSHNMPMPQHRRLSGHRISLLQDITGAGDRERDRNESSSGSMMPHSFSTVSNTQQHLISNPMIYGNRAGVSVLNSMGGLQPSQQNLLAGSLPSQGSSSTPPRHNIAPTSGQIARSGSSGTLRQYPAGQSSFLPSGQPSIKSEPGGFGAFVKEEPGLTKSPLHPSVVQSHYTQLPQGHPFPSHQAQQQVSSLSLKNDQQIEKDTERRPAKEELLQAMDKVDKEIIKVQSEMTRLERKKQQLETVAKKPPQAEKPASPKKVEPKHRDLWQVIYAENKKKAEAARAMLDHLGQRYEIPVYNQPCDTKVYQDNLKKNEEMRPKLLAYFQRKSQLSNIRERYLCARYDQLMCEWQKKAEKLENNIKRKAKEAKVRDFFEKQFPEIRKQREQHERFSRSGTRGDACRSEADFNEIVDGLSEQENHEQHMRQLAVVPPMLLDRDERRLKFINNNGLVTDPMNDYKKRQELDHWSPHEKQIFKERYIQHPKNFHVIASFLEKKSVSDCVLFYYLSKKSVGYKGLVRKNTLKQRKPKSGRGHTQQATTTTAGQDVPKSGQVLSEKSLADKDAEQKKESPDIVMKEEEVERIERPPSPRITRSRNKNLNWTDEDIVTVKEGFGKHGKDFAAISRLFQNKTEHQVKNFYHNYKKKHNLDQLIADGKKKKPNEGSRRTRTQVPTSESSNNATADDEVATVVETRPKSAEPHISMTESTDGIKKKKKEAESEKEKKDDSMKSEEAKKTDATKSSDTETSSATTAPRVTTPVPSATGPYRTRRSAAAANNGNDSGRSESAKRSSDRSPVDEPAEKKMRKSKTAKSEQKVENKEPATSGEKKKTEVKETSPAEKDEDEDATKKEAVKEATAKDAVTTLASEKEKPISTTIVTSVMASTAPSAATIATAVVAVTPVTTVAVTSATVAEPPKSVHGATKVTKTATAPKSPLVHQKLRSENDGDSSATCSADEEPNMLDVATDSTKSSQSRKHADSPYAFEDDSSASIKLEPRTQAPSVAAVITTMSIQLPLPASTQSTIASQQKPLERPSSTHAAPPQFLLRPQLDEKRPQSLPPPPGALAGASVPLGAVRFQMAPTSKQLQEGDSRPNSTPMFAPGYYPLGVPFSTHGIPALPYPAWTVQAQGKLPESFIMPPGPTGSQMHIIGKVPEPSEFRSALQISANAGLAPKPGISMTMAKPTVVSGITKQSDIGKNQTIDLTKPQSSSYQALQDQNKSPPGRQPGPRPHYHPVSTAASSIIKDFSGHRYEAKHSEEMVSRPHKYTATDIASMKDRAATIPTVIPVSSLRAPMPSSSRQPGTSRDTLRTTAPEQIIKKEPAWPPHETRDKRAALPHKSDPLPHPGFPHAIYSIPGALPVNLAQPHMVSSSIQPKVVSGSLTSGAPVLQKQLVKQPITTLPISIDVGRPDTKPGVIEVPKGLIYPGAPYEGPRPPLIQSTHLDERGRPVDPIKQAQTSRASILKGIPMHEVLSGAPRRTTGLEDPTGRNKSPSPSIKTYPSPSSQAPKSLPGSIITGMPVHRPGESRPDHRAAAGVRTATNIIPGREIVVQAPYPRSPPQGGERPTLDPAKLQDPKFHEMFMAHYARLPHGLPGHGAPLKPEHMSLRGPPPTGSILAGTPVKRKPSEESNSSLSPSANPAPFPGVVVSRPSPTIPKQERKPSRGSNQSPAENVWPPHPGYPTYLPGPGGDKLKKEDIFHGSRLTPDKSGRDPTPRSATSSPGHRRTPTGLLSQHPSIKQEVPGSPRSGDDPIRRVQALMLDPQQLAANPDLFRMQMQMPLANYPWGQQGPPAGRGEVLDILRQYGGGGTPGASLYPLYLSGLAGYPGGLIHGIGPAGSPLAPRSPQTGGDEGMETTKKLLHQDFVTAQLMRNPTSVPGPQNPLGFPHGTLPLTNPALTAAHPVISGTSAYHHPLGAYHPGSLPVDRINFIPQHPIAVPTAQGVRSPFSPHYQPPSGRSSAVRSPIPISPGESRRSPIQRPTKTASPDFGKQRHLSGESRELAMHPAIKERNSPASPLSYHSPRGNTSPRDRYTPQGHPAPHQSSPSHPSQRAPPQSTKPYYHYPSATTPPGQLPHQSMSPRPVGPYHPLHLSASSDALNTLVDTASKASRATDRSSPFVGHHSRTGSLDAGKQARQERIRPDSSSPHPRSLPQSPNMPHDPQKPQQYPPSGIKQESRQSPKPQKQYQPPMPGRDGSKMQGKQDEMPYMGQISRHQNSPKPAQKMPGQVEGRPTQPPMSSHPSSTTAPPRKTRSPYPPQQNIIHGVPTYSEDGPRIMGKPPQSKPTDLSAGPPQDDTREQAERSGKKMSKNPGEDLKKSGRAKMTAANLIDAIININYHARDLGAERGPFVPSQTEPRGQMPPRDAPGRHSNSPRPAVNMPPTTSKQPAGPGPTDKPHLAGQSAPPKQNAPPSSQGRYEPEAKPGPPSTVGLPQMQFRQWVPPPAGVMVPQIRPTSTDGGQLDQGKAADSSPTMNRTLSFGEHSADVIDECYRKKADSTPSPVPFSKPESSHLSLSRSSSGSMQMEPISPPESRMQGSNKPDPIKKPTQAQPQPIYQQQPPFTHQQMQRFPLSSAAPNVSSKDTPGMVPRLPTQVPPARPTTMGLSTMAPTMTAPPMPTATPNNSSLEEIIRKALMQNNGSESGTTPSDRRSQEPNMQGISSDAFLTHAMMMSMRPPSMQVAPVKPKPQEPWKENVTTQQPQSGSGGYMSALMLRQMQSNAPPQNVPSPATSAERQQYYGGQPAPRTTHAAPAGSTQPEPQGESGGQQRHQAPAMLPQYEALSDSD